MPDPLDPTATDLGPLSTEERDDLQDAIDQDKELRWLEHDASVAEKALLDAPDGLKGEDLRKLHRTHRDAQQRLAAAHAAVMAFLAPQFTKRREARKVGDDVVVFTREEFRALTMEERGRMEMAGRDGQRIAAELKEKSREMLEARGWRPRVVKPAKGGKAPTLSRVAWQLRQRLGAILSHGSATASAVALDGGEPASLAVGPARSGPAAD